MSSCTLLAAAKINWSLDVLGRRADGYHLLKMIMQRISLFDTVTVSIGAVDALSCDGNLPQDERNLAFRAWLLLKKELGLKDCLQIKVEKQIPAAAGLGGGSADAAAVLLAANRLLKLGLKGEELAPLALSLGADVPFCLLGGAALAEGIGEILTPLPGLPAYHLVVANPGIGVSTPEIFRAFDAIQPPPPPIDTEGLLKALKAGDIPAIGGLLANHLEWATLKKYPVVAKLKEDMSAAGLYPLMSGSGASVFGLAVGAEEAEAAAERLAAAWPLVYQVHTL